MGRVRAAEVDQVDHPSEARPVGPAAASPEQARVPVDWRRLRQPLAYLCFTMSFVGAIGTSLGSVAAGRLAEEATGPLLIALAVCVVGAATVDTVAKTLWAGVVDRAEGRLRSDLLDAAMAQPLADLTEQAVGEVLDRVDDDTWEVGQLLRWGVWQAARTLLASGPLWLVAALTWWPAAFLFPLTAVAAVLVVRRLLPRIAELKVIEEMAWTDHAAATEEGVAARDDLRTSLGQAHVLRRNARLTATVHAALDAVLRVEARVTRRSGTLLHAVLAGTAVLGVALVAGGDLSTAALVTLFLVTTTFVGQVDMLARHLPDLQEGFGAVLRLRSMMAARAEPTGGRPLPDGPLERGVPRSALPLRRPARSPCARSTCSCRPVTPAPWWGAPAPASPPSRRCSRGRSSPSPARCCSAASTYASWTCRRCAPPSASSPSAPRSWPARLAENITLFGAHPRATVEAAVAELGLTDWVAGLPAGLDTELGPGGTSLSAGEEQLVAFARLLVRDVRVVVLDEATARMDPVTEARVVRAADRLISGRTGLLVAHRLSTTRRAEQVAVLEAGRVVQHGRRERLAAEDGPFRRLLTASASEADVDVDDHPDTAAGIGSIRRSTTPPPPPEVRPPPSLTRATWRALTIEPQWGLLGMGLFLLSALTGAFGAVTGWIWGLVVTDLQDGVRPVGLTVALVASLAGQPAAALAGVPGLPALVDLGAAAGARRRPQRPDPAAPAGADAAG